MQFTCIIFHIDPTCFGIIISPSSGSRKQSFFKIYMSILTYILNKFFLQPSQDSDTITPKNVDAMYRVLRINDRIVHLLVLHVLFTYGINHVKGIRILSCLKTWRWWKYLFCEKLNVVIIS